MFDGLGRTRSRPALVRVSTSAADERGAAASWRVAESHVSGHLNEDLSHVSYHIYRTPKASIFVISRTQEGAESAREAHGPLLYWKSVESLSSAVGADPQSVVDASVAANGFHLQSTKVTFTELDD